MTKINELKLAYTVELLNQSVEKHNQIKTLIERCIADWSADNIMRLHPWDEPFEEIVEMLSEVHNVLAKVCGQDLPFKKPGKKEELFDVA